MTNSVILFHEQARLSPQRPALIDVHHGKTRSMSFAELEQASAHVAELFVQSGLRTGDTVLVFHPMSIELYVALVAMFRLGLAAMVVDPSGGRAHIERCCRLVQAQALFASPKAQLLRLIAPAVGRIKKIYSPGWMPGTINIMGWEHTTVTHAIQELPDQAPALLTFTSGSTGLPKCAVRSHGFLLAQHAALAHSLALQDGDVDMVTLPTFVLANLASGLTSVIANGDLQHLGRVAPAPILAQMQAHAIERLTTSPAFLERLIEHCEDRQLGLPSLRSICIGGAAIFPALVERLEHIAPQARIRLVYGATEAEPIAHIDACAITAADTAAMYAGQGILAGMPAAAIDVRIMRDQWGTPCAAMQQAEFMALLQPAGKAGEIVVHGRHVLAGYRDGHGDMENKIRVDGAVWHRTGDAGYLDARGRLWLLGRCAAQIHDERGDLSAFAVECVAQRHAAVRRAALIGYAGQRLLCLEVKQHQDVGQLAQLKQELAWAQLDAICIVPKLPVDKRHNAKIDYQALEAPPWSLADVLRRLFRRRS